MNEVEGEIGEMEEPFSEMKNAQNAVFARKKKYSRAVAAREKRKMRLGSIARNRLMQQIQSSTDSPCEECRPTL